MESNDNPFASKSLILRSPPSTPLRKDMGLTATMNEEIIAPKIPKQNLDSSILTSDQTSETSESTYTSQSDSNDSEEEGKDDFVEFRELKIFERMENLTNRHSFCSQGSVVERFMDSELSFEDEDAENNFDNKSRTSSSHSSYETTTNSVTDDNFTEYSEDVEENNLKICSPSTETRMESLMREMYKIIKPRQTEQEQDPDSEFQCAPAIIMIKLKEQEKAMKEMERELHLTKELRKALQAKEEELLEERLTFDRLKEIEKSKLGKQEKRILMHKKSIEKVSEEMTKLRDQNAEQLTKITTLNKKIMRIESDLKRKSNLWETERKKLMDRIALLEKLNKELETLAKSDSRGSEVKSRNSNTQQLTRTQSQKRIHFSEDSQKLTSTTTYFSRKPVLSLNNPQPLGLKNSTACVENSFESNKNAVQLRSSLKKQFPPENEKKTDDKNSLTLTQIKSNSVTSWYDTNLIEKIQSPEPENPENQEQVPDSENQSHRSCTTVNEAGDTETVYSNGSRKFISKLRNFSRIIYQNGDIKEKRPDGSIHYFFSESGIRQYHYPNGLEMLSYPNGQMERKNPDGTHEILYPDGIVKFYRLDGKQDYIFPDNTVYQKDTDGDGVLLLPNGQKEIHSTGWKKRIYPDGTTKTLYNDGTVETEYPNGRVRRKDALGNLISDFVKNLNGDYIDQTMGNENNIKEIGTSFSSYSPQQPT